MQLIIPMAGLGTRMRPHTWSRPKPLLSLAGRPILDHILQRFHELPIDEYVFVVGWLGEQVEAWVKVHSALPATFVRQEERLGQAHAIWLAHEHLKGPLFLTYVDTLFDGADLSGLDQEGLDGIIFTQEVEDPRRFGVVETDDTGCATRLIEKPDTTDNKTVLIGLYYFRDGEWLSQACRELMDRGIKTKGEYYLADAITLMIQQGAHFYTRPVAVWQDTGKPETTLKTHRYLLDHGGDNSYQAPRPGVVINPPVFVHPEAIVEQSVIGPYVSIERGARVRDSILRDVVVDEETAIEGMLLQRSLIGRWVTLRGEFRTYNIGDSSTVD